MEPRSKNEEQALRRIVELAPEMAEFTAAMVRIPTVNPPGENYEDCARLIGERYARFGYTVEYLVPEGHPDHSARHPRLNVLARMEGGAATPCVHFNGHIDVVPPGAGWTEEPFGGCVRNGKLYGRGASDMKSGIAASLFAVEAIRRAGVSLRGSVEQSATVDEESGGFAGVAWMAELGYFRPARQQHVIITEPLGVDCVCLGHRGAWWFEVTTQGRIAHGSMPFLGVSAIDQMQSFLAAISSILRPRLAERVTQLPVEPRAARCATLNINAIHGGQPPEQQQTPCVADHCTAVFDRRFLPEEFLEDVRREVRELLETLARQNPDFQYELCDRMVVHPTFTPAATPVAVAVAGAIHDVSGREAAFIASPGTYDQKHLFNLAKIRDCIAYGPGALELAHQPDEYVALADLETAAGVLALAVLRLAGGERE